MPAPETMPSHLDEISAEARSLAVVLAATEGVEVLGITVRDDRGSDWHLEPDGTVSGMWPSSSWASGKAEVCYRRGPTLYRIELIEVPF
jgi:hypothetical protein